MGNQVNATTEHTDDGRIVILEWKKQEEEQGPPAEERLGEQDLVAALASQYHIHAHGSLNSSHYCIVLSR